MMKMPPLAPGGRKAPADRFQPYRRLLWLYPPKTAFFSCVSPASRLLSVFCLCRVVKIIELTGIKVA
ncbi:hypothetical protein ACH95_11895 [Bacillus glycinifermentans]|uniref:Uncharacterized protein n=1 Tax=Bacillus glycinifermentans TaxID=1664069 RepID=A0A0J6EPI8_9BACI|nr:hypothetical protein COP00_14000 [Bacillus glycinifermentans]KMM59150.1 hypothetical protein ACH95_11895 [Bacillus glycinifermentans]KRT90231.1 hypothetical protein AB447_206525 [Bacillus glycinifermentans]